MNLPTSAVIAWNTVAMAIAIYRVRIDDHSVQEAASAHLSPCRYEYNNPYGKYACEVSEDLGRGDPRGYLVFVRLLREALSASPSDRPLDPLR